MAFLRLLLVAAALVTCAEARGPATAEDKAKSAEAVAKILKHAGIQDGSLAGKNATEIMAAFYKMHFNMSKVAGHDPFHALKEQMKHTHDGQEHRSAGVPYWVFYIVAFMAGVSVLGLIYIMYDEHSARRRLAQGYVKVGADAPRVVDE